MVSWWYGGSQQGVEGQPGQGKEGRSRGDQVLHSRFDGECGDAGLFDFVFHFRGRGSYVHGTFLPQDEGDSMDSSKRGRLLGI